MDEHDNDQGKQWATAVDWDRHRQIITKLYEDNRMTLREVVETMERNHKFYATPKMYKNRLRQWGIRKYGRRQEGPRLANYCHRRQQAVALTIADPREGRVCFFQGDMDGIKAFQAGLGALDSFTSRALAQNLKVPSPQEIYSHRAVDWAAQLATGAVLIRHAHHYEGFRLIDDCLRRLAIPDPAAPGGAGLQTIIDVGMAGYIMSTVNEDLYTSFLRYVTQLAAVRVGKRDPLCRFCDAMLRMGQADHVAYGMGYGPGLLDMIANHFGAGGQGFTPEQRAAYLRVQGWITGLCYAQMSFFQEQLLGHQALNGSVRTQCEMSIHQEEKVWCTKLLVGDDSCWEERLSMWHDRVSETEAVLARFPINPKVIERRGFRFISFIDDDDDNGGREVR